VGQPGTGLYVENYFTGSLEATYNLDTDGSIANAIPEPEGKWKDLIWDEVNGKWTKAP